MRKACKNIIALSVVLIAGLTYIVPAFAQDPFSGIAIGGIGGASGAGLFNSMAGMSGVDIAWSQQGSDPMDAMWNTLNPDHVYFSGEKHEADPQTYPEDIWDYITVDIGDWLNAQSDFITEFINTNNVTDNSSGTIQVPKTYGGYSLNNTIITGVSNCSLALASVELPTSAGLSTSISNGVYSATILRKDRGYHCEFAVNGVSAGSSDNTIGFNGTATLHLQAGSNNNVWITIVNRTNPSIVGSSNNIGKYSDTTTAWSSNIVNNQVFDGWESARIKIPHSISGLTSGWTVPDFTNALNDLWNQGLEGQIVIEDTDQPVPPPPIPSTPLGEVPFDDWIDLWGQGIYQQLENQSDALDFIGSNGEDTVEELESIDSNLDDLNETAESIDTNIGTGIGLLGGIKSAVESGVDFLEGIAEHVEELVEEIVEGTETLIAGILNQIPTVFGVIFGPIKQASSIWHYVVEWIQSISGPMSWIWSMASGTSYNIILPVYASLAGAVVLAFYKRFGK